MTVRPKRLDAPKAAKEAPISEMTQRIVERVNPLQVILFGSRARGEQRRGSDVDLLVIVPDDRDRDHVSKTIHDALREVHVSKDVLVTMPGVIRRYGNLVGMVYRPALRQGRVLYDAERGYAVWSSGDEASCPPPPEGGIVTDEVRIAETRRWLDRASKDLGLAELHAQGEHLEPAAACYHAQQSAEKALKAVLIFLQIEFETTHNLDDLGNLVPVGWRLKDEHADLERLSDWAVKARYPGDWADPTEADARKAARQARAVYESVVRDLRQHGFKPEDNTGQRRASR